MRQASAQPRSMASLRACRFLYVYLLAARQRGVTNYTASQHCCSTLQYYNAELHRSTQYYCKQLHGTARPVFHALPLDLVALLLALVQFACTSPPPYWRSFDQLCKNSSLPGYFSCGTGAAGCASDFTTVCRADFAPSCAGTVAPLLDLKN